MASNTNIGSVTSKKFRKLVLTHLEELNTPRSLSIFILMKYEQDSDVPNLTIDPLWFNDEFKYREFSIPTSFVKKWVGLRVNVDPTEQAKNKFLECEVLCRHSNHRIRTDTPLGRTRIILDRARKIIRSVLPEINHDFLDRLGDLGGWGKGATSSCKGKWLAPYNKIGAVPQSTPAFLPIVRKFLEETPIWFNLHNRVESVPYNKVSFVPKTAVTDRPIAVEPSMNAFFQKAIGKALRPSLRQLGVNLAEQEKNQFFAHLASKEGKFATIDLSSASDTISKAIVEYLLPSDWVALLSLTRSEHYLLDGEIHRYEKWSSMGNGYTFELESLIFSSICLAIVRHRSKYAVYGDDIIIPVDAYGDLANCLEWCGFIINKEKSFSDSYFRESCGADYFDGYPVRSFFLKKEDVSTLYVWANTLRSNPVYSGFNIKRTWNAIKKAIPHPVFGPAGTHGLLLLEVNYDEVSPDYSLLKRPFGPWIGYRITGWRWQPLQLRRSQINGGAAVVASWWKISSKIETFQVTDSLAVSASGRGTWKRRWTITPDWPQLRNL